MTTTLAVPLRLGPDGRARTLAQGTRPAIEQALAATLLTRRGERTFRRRLGTPDPRFASVDPAAVNASAAIYGPAVQVTGVTAEPEPGRPGVVRVRLAYRDRT